MAPSASSHPPVSNDITCWADTPGSLKSRDALTATDAGHLPSDSTVGGRASHARAHQVPEEPPVFQRATDATLETSHFETMGMSD